MQRILWKALSSLYVAGYFQGEMEGIQSISVKVFSKENGAKRKRDTFSKSNLMFCISHEEQKLFGCSTVTIKYHKITKPQSCLGWKGPLKMISFNPHGVDRDNFHYIRELKAASSLALNTSRDGPSTTSQGNLFQCLTNLIVKDLFLLSNLNFPPFSLKALPLVLSLQALAKSLVLLSPL